MQRGEIWMATLPFSGGREQSGERPVLVIQDAVYRQGSPLVLVVLLTSQQAASRFPATVEVTPTATNGLTLSSIAMVFQARALDRSRFRRKLGTIEADVMNTILTELNKLTGQQK